MNWKSVKQGIYIAVISTLAGCAQFGNHAPLATPMAHSSLATGPSAEAREAWWLQLNDHKLNALIATAVKSSPDLRIAKARFDQAQAQLGETRTHSKAQWHTALQGKAVYAATKPSADIPTHKQFLSAHGTLEGNWSFDFWGKNRSQIASAIGRRQAILYEAQHTRIQLANAVAAHYFAWQAAHARQTLLDQRIILADKTITLIKRRISAALMPSETLYPAELARQQLELEKYALSQQTAQIQHTLSALVGRAPEGLGLTEPNPSVMPPTLHTRRIYADFLGTRPDIAAQKSYLTARLHNIKATEATFYPNIELNVLAGLSHIDAFNIVRGSSTVLGVAPALHLPIFNTNALQSRLAGRRAEYNEQVAHYDQTVLNAMRNAANALTAYQNSRAKQAVWQKMLTSAEQAVRAAKKRLHAGLDNGLSSIQKEDDAIKLKIQHSEWQAELLTAWSNVHAELGGGFRAKTSH